MSNWKDITKAEFDIIYRQHQPNWWTRMIFKYFSKSTEKKDMKPGHIVIGFLIGAFLVGFFATAFNLARSIIAFATWGYVVVLTILVLSLFTAVFMNNARLKKVMKELVVSKTEYNMLVEKFYP